MFRKRQKTKNYDAENEILLENTEELPDLNEEVKPPKKKLPGWVIIPALGVLVVIFFICSKLFGGESQTVLQLETVAVKRAEVKEDFSISGMVNSEKTKVFYSPVNAPILECNAEVGQTVKAGDVLVKYDITTLERDNQQSELNSLSTKYTNQDTVEQANRAAASTAAAESQASSSVQSLKKQIQDKQAEVDSLQSIAASSQSEAAKNAAAAAEIQKKMQENLDNQSKQKAIKENAERELKDMSSTDTKYNELMSTAQQATNNLSNLEIAYRELENKLSAVGSSDASGTAQVLEADKQELAALKSSLTEMQNSSQSGGTATGTTNAQKKNMQVAENLAELTQLTTEELLSKGKEGIKAEFDGIISDVQVVEGTSAVQGGQLFTLVSNQDVAVELEVSSNDFDKLIIGTKATVKIGQKTYEGTLTSVDKIALPNAKGNPVIGAEVHIDNPDDEIYIGVNAKVAMTVAEKKNALSLPNEVVNTSAEGDFVYVIEGGIVKKQTVDLGVASDNMVEIVSGLKEGDQVISDVSGDVEEGMQAIAISGEE